MPKNEKTTGEKITYYVTGQILEYLLSIFRVITLAMNASSWKLNYLEYSTYGNEGIFKCTDLFTDDSILGSILGSRSL